MFEIEFTEEAYDDLSRLRRFDFSMITHAIEDQLGNAALTETRNRKRLRPNKLAEWELRADVFRIFYDVVSPDETPLVRVIAIGEKRHGDLYIRGERFEL